MSVASPAARTHHVRQKRRLFATIAQVTGSAGCPSLTGASTANAFLPVAARPTR